MLMVISPSLWPVKTGSSGVLALKANASPPGA